MSLTDISVIIGCKIVLVAILAVLFAFSLSVISTCDDTHVNSIFFLNLIPFGCFGLFHLSDKDFEVLGERLESHLRLIHYCL